MDTINIISCLSYTAQYINHVLPDSYTAELTFGPELYWNESKRDLIDDIQGALKDGSVLPPVEIMVRCSVFIEQCIKTNRRVRVADVHTKITHITKDEVFARLRLELIKVGVTNSEAYILLNYKRMSRDELRAMIVNCTVAIEKGLPDNRYYSWLNREGQIVSYRKEEIIRALKSIFPARILKSRIEPNDIYYRPYKAGFKPYFRPIVPFCLSWFRFRLLALLRALKSVNFGNRA